MGLPMLAGMLDLRRGITVIFGCFLLFGASGIAAALTGLAGGDTQVRQPTTPDPGQLSGPLSSAAPPTAYDPYAGASSSEERRVWKGFVSTFRSRWWPYH